MADKWPKTVPILRAENIRMPEDGRGDPNQRSLFLWLHVTFRDSDQFRSASDCIRGEGGCTIVWLAEYCSRGDQARAWNRAMRKLGYTESI